MYRLTSLFRGTGRCLFISKPKRHVAINSRLNILFLNNENTCKMNRVLCYGHRGMGCSMPPCTSLFPENTITSFLHALKCGAHGIELDVFLAISGQVLVIHGLDEGDLICGTALKGHQGLQNFNFDDTVESLTLPASQVCIRKPWALLDSPYKGQFDFTKSTDHEKIEAATKHYIQQIEPYKIDDKLERLPTLRQVLETLGPGCKYDIELKGTKPELGKRVLDILEDFPDYDVFITSFNWIPPALGDLGHADSDEQLEPNGPIVQDLLRPLVNNHLKIPLGLLLSRLNKSLPSIDRIVQCANSFNAKWVVIPHDFWKAKTPILGAPNFEKPQEALSFLLEHLHRHNLKVASYWLSTEPDKVEDLKLHVEAKIDTICPNDVETALELISQYSE